MTDLEMTKRCAEKMGLTKKLPQPWARPYEDQRGRYAKYDPLHDDAQAMELVRRFRLSVNSLGVGDTALWIVKPDDSDNGADSKNLNRAIVECVVRLP